MIDRALFTLTLLCALGSGLIAGVFFAFSNFVMKALERLPAAQGIAAMQAINVTVLNRLFLGIFVGTAIVCVATTVVALAFRRQPFPVAILVGTALYVVGTFIVTGACNVPRNDIIAAVDPNSAEAVAVWADYLRSWTTWNTVRTIASFVSSASFIIALRG
ncbi:MAG: DUF1772 domain-containing protein [Polyangiaceae bacterium]|nr:DUF1772 domain-containing protein [Polyangiaceae bacterium]